MAITVVNTVSSAPAAAVSSLTLTLPTVADNDWLVCIVAGTGSASAVVSSTNTGTIGGSLTAVGTRQNVSGHSSTMWKRKLVAADSGKTIVFVFGGSVPESAAGVILRGCDTTDCIDAVQATASATTSPTNTTPTATSVADNCVELSAIASTANPGGGLTNATAPSPLTKQIQAVQTTSSSVAIALTAIGTDLTPGDPAGTVGNRAWTTDATAVRSAYTLTIKPAYVAPLNRVRVYRSSMEHAAPASRVRIYRSDISTPGAAPSRVRVYRSDLRYTTGASSKVRIYRSALSTPAVTPRVRVYRSDLSSGGLSIQAPSSVQSATLVTLTASVSGTVDEWQWAQIPSSSVQLVTDGAKCYFISPATTSGTQVAIQVRARSGATWQTAVASIQVGKHSLWVKPAGTLRPAIVGAGAKLPTPTPGGLVGDSSVIACWGDSLTAGFGLPAGSSWPAVLGSHLTGGRVTYQGGVSGQTSQEIAIRQGGQALTLTADGGSIPASGAVNVTCAESIVWNTTTGFSCVGTLAGVDGTLAHTAAGAFTFTRSTTGSAVPCTSKAFTSKAGADNRGKVSIFFAGRNDYGIGGVDSTIRNRVINANTAMVNNLTDPRTFLIISNTTLSNETAGTRGYNNVTAVNAALAAAYPNNYLDIRSYLVNQCIVDLGITPTAADNTAMAGDTLPPSIMIDNIHYNAAAAARVELLIENKLKAMNVLPSGQSTQEPTLGLPFKLPDGIQTVGAKKVFAHYFGPFPISNDNADPSVDYYARVWNSVTSTASSDGVHPNNYYGGYFRDRPQGRPPISGDYVAADCRTDIAQARAAGIDGFFVDMLGLSGSNYDRYRKLCDQASAMYPDGSFKVVPMVDANGATASGTVQAAAASIAYFAGKPSSYYLPDGRYVVSCFAVENKTASYWSSLFAELSATYGLTVAFIGVAVNTNQLVNYTSVTYGESAWGYGADPNIITKAGNAAGTARGRGKKWMAPVVPQDTRPHNALADEANNTESLRAGWVRAISEDADFVQLVTWSDYSEDTQINVSAKSGWVNLDLCSYYITRWKTGTYPQILRDCIYLSHRDQWWNAPLSSGQTSRMAHWPRGNMSPTRDSIEILTFFTAPATVTVTAGTNTYTYTAPAGVNAQLYPLAEGNIAVSATRSGVQVAQITSPITVTTTPVADALGYFRFSSLRGTAGQFKP